MSVPPDGGSQSVSEPRGEPQPGSGASQDASVQAFLIGDMRGWTSFTQEHGDEGAARLAARFAEVTRTVVEEHRGRVVELRGDEVLAVFDSPRSAIRAAVALQQRFVEESTADASLPLTVGIGLDAGEAVAVEGGFRGGALNVAGRLQAHAKAGEILASREIVHLARRIDGIRFTERGPLALKGLDQPVHVIAVASQEQDAAVAMAPFVRSTAPAPSPHKRWKLVAAVAAFAVLAALVAVPLARNAGGSSEIAPNSIGILDPDSGDVVSTLEGLDARPGSMAASADSVWVSNPDVGTVTRIDPNTQAVVDSIPVGQNPTGVAVGEGAVWVVESGGPSVARISPATNEVVKTIEVGNGPAGIAVGEGAVWVTNRFDGTISRIDPNSGEVVKPPIPVGLDPRGIAIGFGSVWVALAGSNTVVRVDPATNEVSPPISVGSAPGSLAVDADAVWVANTFHDTVSRISPETDSVVDTVPVGDAPLGIAFVGGVVWVANEADATLSRIEPGQTPGEASVRTIVVGSVPQGLADVNGDLWVSARGTSTSHRGGTLRLVGLDAIPTLDPAVAYSYFDWTALHLIGDGLVAFEPIGGTTARLVPDLATSIPTPTDDGKTYTFQLRPGIQYSNGEIVAPTDFRLALERGFRLYRIAHADLYGGLVGGEACADPHGTCDLRQGIVTDAATGTITFHLVDPDPEFLYKLTMPFAYPVPPSVPDEEQLRAGIPGTGPYMLEAPMTDEGLALVRNPRFRVWSQGAQPDGYADRIEWTFGVEPQAQIKAVAAGDADLAFGAAASGRLEEILVRFAAQVHTAPEPITSFVVLNTQESPFDHVGVRRAINFALDRGRMVKITGGEGTSLPTCQQLPPNFPGYEPYCPYTMDPGPEGQGSWTAPDPDEAQRLVDHSGTAGMRVVLEYPDSWDPQQVNYIVELLDDLGYHASAKPVTQGFYSPGNKFQMTLGIWGADYPAASSFITPFFTCDASATPLAGFCDPGIDAMIDHAIRRADDPAAAGALWAEVDHAIVDEAPFVWFENPIAVEFVSERVGNYQRSPQWGVLLNQLWVR